MDFPSRQRSVFLLGPERIELREAAVPEPGPGEVVVRIGAATTCGTDVKVFRRGGHPRMLFAPTPFGHEMAGLVASIGPGVERFRAGDRVAIANSAPCGSCAFCHAGRENLCCELAYLNGAFADYVLVPPRFVERSLYPCPEGLRFEHAALAEPLACVLHGLDLCAVAAPVDALVLGGGPIGLLFVHLLALGGHRVVAGDPHPPRLAVARALGAAATFEAWHDAAESGAATGLASHRDGFDLAVEASGSPDAWEAAIAALRPGGTALLFGGCAPGTSVKVDTHRLHYSELKLLGAYHHRPATYERALALLAGGGLEVARLLSGERPLEQLGDALASMMRREALKVVIRP